METPNGFKSIEIDNTTPGSEMDPESLSVSNQESLFKETLTVCIKKLNSVKPEDTPLNSDFNNSLKALIREL